MGKEITTSAAAFLQKIDDAKQDMSGNTTVFRDDVAKSAQECAESADEVSKQIKEVNKTVLEQLDRGVISEIYGEIGNVNESAHHRMDSMPRHRDLPIAPNWMTETKTWESACKAEFGDTLPRKCNAMKDGGQTGSTTPWISTDGTSKWSVDFEVVPVSNLTLMSERGITIQPTDVLWNLIPHYIDDPQNPYGGDPKINVLICNTVSYFDLIWGSTTRNKSPCPVDARSMNEVDPTS